MKNMTLENIAEACGGKLCNAAMAKGYTEAKQIVIDSRQIGEGDVFIATRGARVDGHSFISNVFEKGALGVVCEEEPCNPKGPYILVEDSFEALRRIAEYYRRQLSVKVVGITGSVGKTSTKEFIAGVLEEKYSVFKTQGNFNNEIGVPLMILKIRENHEVAVLEMGINHFGEMSRLTEMAKPDICVMTNIGQCHLEFLGSREGILKAKSEIFEYANPEGYVIVNGDDDMLQTIKEVYGKRPIRFGFGQQNDICANNVKLEGVFGSEAGISGQENQYQVNIKLPGEHQVYNAMAAIAVSEVLGLSQEEIIRGVANVKPVGGRSNLIQTKEFVLIDDCYNANPVSMRSAIDLLMMADGRKVAILGDMFELGEKEAQMHASIGAYCAQKGVDVLICAGELSWHMAKEAEGYGGIEVHYFKEKAAMLVELLKLLQKEDTILIKASHGMEYTEIVTMLSEL